MWSLSAGASAPEVLVTEVVAYLKRLGSSEEVEELTVIKMWNSSSAERTRHH